MFLESRKFLRFLTSKCPGCLRGALTLTDWLFIVIAGKEKQAILCRQDMFITSNLLLILFTAGPKILKRIWSEKTAVSAFAGITGQYVLKVMRAIKNRKLNRINHSVWLFGSP